MNVEALDMVRSVEAVDRDVLRVRVKSGSAYHFEDVIAGSTYRLTDYQVSGNYYWITVNNSLLEVSP